MTVRTRAPRQWSPPTTTLPTSSSGPTSCISISSQTATDSRFVDYSGLAGNAELAWRAWTRLEPQLYFRNNLVVLIHRHLGLLRQPHSGSGPEDRDDSLGLDSDFRRNREQRLRALRANSRSTGKTTSTASAAILDSGLGRGNSLLATGALTTTPTYRPSTGQTVVSGPTSVSAPVEALGAEGLENLKWKIPMTERSHPWARILLVLVAAITMLQPVCAQEGPQTSEALDDGAGRCPRSQRTRYRGAQSAGAEFWEMAPSPCPCWGTSGSLDSRSRVART